MSGLERLSERRREIFSKFAQKCSKNERFAPWFPPALDTGHDTRKRARYHEPKARTERFRKSPVLTMIRELNEME